MKARKNNFIKYRSFIKLDSLCESYTFYGSNKSELELWRKHLGRFCICKNFNEKYKLNSIISKGSFSIVCEGHKLHNLNRVIIKSILKQTIKQSAALSVIFII